MSRVQSLEAVAYRIPTDGPESDGTIEWSSTTLVVVEAAAAGRRGLGYTYAHVGAARFVAELASVVCGQDAARPEASWRAMLDAVRNIGRPGLVACAISAADAALWDLKARLLDVSLLDLWGPVRDSAAVYGSGGFTSYSDEQLREQLAGWVEQGCSMVKMKIGRQPHDDPRRMALAREAIGDRVQLFVDANGAFRRPDALAMLPRLAELDVRWFEEPVSSDDLVGLRQVRERAPFGVAITAGEYGYDPWYFEHMLAAEAVHVLMADATRCTGFTGLRKIAALCEARGVPLSAHCAPALHLHAACALGPMAHIEYFHDHQRIERMLFDGLPPLSDGRLRPDRGRPGHGLTFKRKDADRFRVA